MRKDYITKEPYFEYNKWKDEGGKQVTSVENVYGCIRVMKSSEGCSPVSVVS